VVHESTENANQAGQTAPQDDPDERSVWVKNVDFTADEAQLTEHFKECGDIVRVTIKKNH
jgi:RNA recognition motif-containing protein